MRIETQSELTFGQNNVSVTSNTLVCLRRNNFVHHAQLRAVFSMGESGICSLNTSTGATLMHQHFGLRPSAPTATGLVSALTLMPIDDISIPK
jgi:hypothetical protein